MRGLHWWPHGWHLWLDNGRCQAETQRNTQVHIFGRLLHKASTLPVVVWKLDRFKKWDRSRESHYVLTGSRQELWWRCMGFFFTGFTELGWCMQYLMCWYGMNAIWCPKRLHFLVVAKHVLGHTGRFHAICCWVEHQFWTKMFWRRSSPIINSTG
jgi:hypothetical protein